MQLWNVKGYGNFYIDKGLFNFNQNKNDVTSKLIAWTNTACIRPSIESYTFEISNSNISNSNMLQFNIDHTLASTNLNYKYSITNNTFYNNSMNDLALFNISSSTTSNITIQNNTLSMRRLS